MAGAADAVQTGFAGDGLVSACLEERLPLGPDWFLGGRHDAIPAVSTQGCGYDIWFVFALTIGNTIYRVD